MLRTMMLATMCLFLYGCGVSDALEKSEPVIEDFHALYNTQAYGAMYDDLAHSALQDAHSQQSFIEIMRSIRGKLGRFENGSRASYRAYTGTKGRRIELSYESTFANGMGVEHFLLVAEDGVFKLQSYNVNSPALLMTPKVDDSERDI